MGVQLDDALIGRVLGGKFRLRSVVGAGSSGAVYQADQTALGRTVAVKLLRPELARDPRLVTRFHDEALAASRLNHPNTVSVIDYGQTDDSLLYIVMEYLRGVTLTHLIHNESPLADARIVDLVSQVLSGLEEAHHAGVIHADLKSDNIVVERRRGGWDLVKVVDFGIARLLETPPAEEDRRTICGTPEYMAPEVIGGADPTVASDLYAVGVVLYEILAGTTPFVGGSSLEVLTRHLRQEPIPPSMRRPGRVVSPLIESIVLRALAKKPADRFASAVEFRRALEQVLERDDSSPVVSTVRCDGCGLQVSLSFKFCPECGYRLATGVIGMMLEDVTTEPHRASAAVDCVPTVMVERDTVYDMGPPAGVAGLWPLPLIGRDEHIAQINRFVAAAEPPMLQLVGDSGVGRTRLLREIYQRLGEDNTCMVYRAGPDPSGLASAYYPIRAVVAAVLALPPICAYDSLSNALKSLGLSRRDLPGIAELFGHHGELWQLEPHIRRRELVASTARVFRAAGAQGRAVLLFDDVDRYDLPSQELLAHLAESALKPAADAGAPLRLIVAHGPALGDIWPAGTERIELGTLGADELTALALYAEETGHEGMPSAAELATRTDGTPGHIRHLLRFIVEGGSLEGAPETAADLIAERIKSLPHRALVLCQTAAVFGAEVDRGVLARVLASVGAELFDESLSLLKARGLFFENRDVVGFTSQLVRDIAYDATPADVRRELHAAVLVAISPLVADPLILGHHHELAGNLLEAAMLLMRAGDDAAHQLDDLGATLIYHRALEAARKLMLAEGDGENRTRFVILSVKLADALRVRGDAILARGLIEEARSYSDGNRRLDAQLLQASAHLSLVEHKHNVAIDTLHRAIGLLIPVGEMELLAELYLDLSSIHMELDDLGTAIEQLGEGLDLITLGEGKSTAHGPEILWRLLLRLAQLHGMAGQTDKALDLAQGALIHARRVRSRIGSARVQTMLATYYAQLGNLGLALQYRQAAVNEMRRLGDRRGTAELILAGRVPTRTLLRINPAERREARELADEVGWVEGVLQAEQDDDEKPS